MMSPQKTSLAAAWMGHAPHQPSATAAARNGAESYVREKLPENNSAEQVSSPARERSSFGRRPAKGITASPQDTEAPSIPVGKVLEPWSPASGADRNPSEVK